MTLPKPTAADWRRKPSPAPAAERSTASQLRWGPRRPFPQRFDPEKPPSPFRGASESSPTGFPPPDGSSYPPLDPRGAKASARPSRHTRRHARQSGRPSPRRDRRRARSLRRPPRPARRLGSTRRLTHLHHRSVRQTRRGCPRTSIPQSSSTLRPADLDLRGAQHRSRLARPSPRALRRLHS